MGNFYFNYTLKGPTSARVARALKGHKSLVTPEQSGCVVVFIDSPYPFDAEPALPQELSRHLQCPVLSVTNYDDDILEYGLFVGGKVVDEYNSNPDNFAPSGGHRRGPTGGNAALLCQTFGSDRAAEVERILRAPEDTYVVETHRHEDLARTLALSSYAVGLGYKYVSRGDIPEVVGLKPTDMIHTD